MTLRVFSQTTNAPVQSSFVTNWITPGDNYRTVSNTLYDVNRSTRWITLFFPPKHKVRVGAAHGHPFPGELTTVTWGGYNGPEQPTDSFTIYNFPYTPQRFAEVTSETGCYILRAGSERVLLLSSSTNWGTGGKVQSVFRSFDYGLQATNKIPVIAKTKRP